MCSRGCVQYLHGMTAAPLRVRDALLLVHFQRCITDSGICFTYTADDEDRIHRAVAKSADLVESARARSALIVHVAFQRDNGQRFRLGSAPLATFLESVGAFEIGTVGHDFTEALRPHEGDLVIHGYGVSGFVHTDLSGELAARGVDRLVVAGITTSLGVESNVRHAVDLGYTVTVVTDACVDESDAAHDAALHRIAPIAMLRNAADVW